MRVAAVGTLALLLLSSPHTRADRGRRPRAPRAGAVALASAPPQTVELTLPFEGVWGVIQGMEGEDTHVGYAAYAIDFVPAEPRERAAEGTRRRRLSDFPCFGQPVLALADGRVVWAEDRAPDRRPWTKVRGRDPGNFVIVEHAPGEYTELGHLRSGSVRVAVGEMVKRGQPLAQCGSSGNAGTPHLHVGFLGSVDPIATRPMRFSRYEVLGPGGWRAGDGVPRQGEILRPALRRADAP
jgi:murein DD-endopeptidase MepM/ murein hydrolase activator NlpD